MICNNCIATALGALIVLNHLTACINGINGNKQYFRNLLQLGYTSLPARELLAFEPLDHWFLS